MKITDFLNYDEYAPYQINYIKLVMEQDIILALKNQEAQMIAFFKQIPTEKLNYKYEPNKWTIKEILLHLIDCERIFAYRALRIARNDATELPGFEENDYVKYSKGNTRDMESLIQEYSTVRKATLSLFESFDSKTLLNKGTASGFSVSVRAIAYCILGHELHHSNIITERYL